MSQADLRHTVIDALLEVAPDVDAGALDSTRAFRDQFDFDSMDYLNFVISLHQRLGIDIPERDYPQLLGLDAAVRYLEEHIAEPADTK
jgi:acyl carrier protein